MTAKPRGSVPSIARRWSHYTRSRLLRLPRPVLEKANRMLLDQGEARKTYQEISDWLKSSGFSISKSSVARYGKCLINSGQSFTDRMEQFIETPEKAQLYQLLSNIVDLFEDAWRQGGDKE